MQNKNQKGSTTAWILGGITAFALLGIAAFAGINANKALARDAERLSDINVIRAALSLYSQNNNGYPSVSPTMPLGINNGTVLCSPSRGRLGESGNPREGFFKDELFCNPDEVFLSPVPKNPMPNSADYMYISTQDGTDYNIVFELENALGPLEKGTNCAKSAGIVKC